jgi:hypothetical protein
MVKNSMKNYEGDRLYASQILPQISKDEFQLKPNLFQHTRVKGHPKK